MNTPVRTPSARAPGTTLPPQARPVRRDAWTAPQAHQDGAGVAAAAKSRCAGLPGLARQMCYAARYGA
ncbi:hypothetical protein OHV05_06395 [Kitasatospora sp. NBC_00070]|uniref:hypothetical protein n=1 Tax=Kitasatospora sp. NBC_00070 TaxID=2975962 RepID=UPI00324848CA